MGAAGDSGGGPGGVVPTSVEPASSAAEADDTKGLPFLVLGVLIHPIDTINSLSYHLNTHAKLGQAAGFYLLMALMPAVVGAWAGAPFGMLFVTELVQFAITVVCILMGGRILGEGGDLLSSAIILGFVRGSTYLVLGGLLMTVAGAAAVGLQGTGLLAALGVGVLAITIWGAILNCVAIMNIFGCSAPVAIGIALLAGFLQNFALRFLGLAR